MARILLTGATSGIGLALAERFSGRGEMLAAGRRSAEEARQILADDTPYVQASQNDPEAAVQAIMHALGQLGWDSLDLAILNAGTGHAGDPGRETPATIRETLDVNLVAPLCLAHALFPLLAKTGGKLVLIGSTSRSGAPQFASYAASKAGLHGLGRALAQEWQGRVTVQTIHPGPTATPMHARAGFDPGRAGRWFLRPETVATMIEDAMRSGRAASNVSHARFLFSRHLWARP